MMPMITPQIPRYVKGYEANWQGLIHNGLLRLSVADGVMSGGDVSHNG